MTHDAAPERKLTLADQRSSTMSETPRPGSRRRRSSAPPDRARRVPRPPSRLAETAGPDPATPLEQVRLVVGVVAGAHGVRGELKVRSTSDDPERLTSGAINQIYLGDDPAAYRVLGARFHAGHLLIRLEGIETPEAATAHRTRQVRISGADARPPEPGEYFLYQVIGLNVVDEAGQPLGFVADIMETGANDVFVVVPPGGGADLLLPNHPDVILDICPTDGTMTVRPLIYE